MASHPDAVASDSKLSTRVKLAISHLALLWGAAHAAQAAFGIVAFRRHPNAGLAPLVTSALVSLPALIGYALFLGAYLFGPWSKRILGDDGYRPWGLWYGLWPALTLETILAVPVTLIALAWPPYARSRLPSFLSRLAAVGATGCSWYALGRWFPDA